MCKMLPIVLSMLQTLSNREWYVGLILLRGEGVWFYSKGVIDVYVWGSKIFRGAKDFKRGKCPLAPPTPPYEPTCMPYVQQEVF